MSDFGSLVYICKSASIFVEYSGKYRGGLINHHLLFNGSVKSQSITEELQVNFSELGRHNLTIVSRNLAWTQVHHLGVVEVTDVIINVQIRSFSTAMQVHDCRSLSVYHDNTDALPSEKLAYSWIVESKTVNFNVTTTENAFSFCPQRTGDYRVLCVIRMKTFCGGKSHEVSGKSNVLKIKVLDISNDDQLVNDESFNRHLSHEENLLEIVAYDSSVDSGDNGNRLQMGKKNRSNVSCFCPLTVHQPEKGIQGCGLDDGNTIEALAISNCDVESSKCFKDTIFVVNIRTQHPTRASWSVHKSLEPYVQFLYYGKHMNNNYVHIEVSVDMESEVLPLIISVHPKYSNLYKRATPCKVKIDIHLSTLPKTFQRMERCPQTRNHQYPATSNLAIKLPKLMDGESMAPTCNAERTIKSCENSVTSLTEKQCEHGEPMRFHNLHMRQFSYAVLSRHLLDLVDVWLLNCMAFEKTVSRLDQEYALHTAAKSFLKHLKFTGPAKQPLDIQLKSELASLRVIRMLMPFSGFRKVSSTSIANRREVYIGSQSRWPDMSGSFALECVNIITLELNKFWLRVKEFNLTNGAKYDVIFNSPVVLLAAECSKDLLPFLSIKLKDTWDVPASHYLNFSSKEAFSKLIFRSNISQVGGVGMSLRVEYVSALLWPLTVQFACSSYYDGQVLSEYVVSDAKEFEAYSFVLQRSALLNSSEAWTCETVITPNLQKISHGTIPLHSNSQSASSGFEDLISLRIGFVGVGCVGSERRESIMDEKCRTIQMLPDRMFYCECTRHFGWRYRGFSLFEKTTVEVQPIEISRTHSDSDAMFGWRLLFIMVILGLNLCAIVKIFAKSTNLEDALDKIVYHMDNSCRNYYCYALSVETGNMFMTGTDNRVFCILHGEHRSSETKELFSDETQCFSSGAITTFLVSTSQSLGKLSRVTIWHDRAPSSSYPYHNQSQRVHSTQPTTVNKSSSSSDPIKACYINRVTVVDIHTLDLYDFPVFEWIGPGFRDGRTDRIICRRKAKSLEKCIKKELLSVTLNSLESFSPFVVPRFRTSSASYLFVLLSLNLVACGSLFTSYITIGHNNHVKVQMLQPGGVFILPTCVWMPSLLVSLCVSVTSFCLYWMLNHIPYGYSTTASEYQEVPTQQNSLTKPSSQRNSGTCEGGGGGVNGQKWWDDIQTWADRIPDYVSNCEMNSMGTTPGTSRRNSYRYFSRETLSSQINSAYSGMRELCRSMSFQIIPKSTLYLFGFHSGILLTLAASFVTCFLISRIDALELIYGVKLFVCTSICAYFLLFPLFTLLCGLISAVISWSFKFPLQLRFVIHLPHACSPLVRSSPTRKNSLCNDLPDVSESVTGSCFALAMRQRARYLKYVRPPQVQHLRSAHIWSLQKLKLFNNLKFLLLAAIKVYCFCSVFQMLAPSSSECDLSDKISIMLDNSCSAFSDSQVVAELLKQNLRLYPMAVWTRKKQFFDAVNLTELLNNPAFSDARVRRFLFYFPVENTYGLTEKKQNESGHWITETRFLSFVWTSRSAIHLILIQTLTFLWLCSKLKTLFFSATRNYSFLDVKLMIHVFFPGLAFAMAVCMTSLWDESLSLFAILRHRPQVAAWKFKLLHHQLENWRVMFGLFVLVYLVSFTRLLKSKLSELKLYERWFYNRLIAIPHKSTVALSGFVVIVGLCQASSIFAIDLDFKVLQSCCPLKWSLPKGLLLFAMSRVIFTVKPATKQPTGLSVRQKKNLSFLNSLWAFFRFYLGKAKVYVAGSMTNEQSGSMSRGSFVNTSSGHDSLKRYHVPLRLECLMDELEKQVDELMCRTMALSSHLHSVSTLATSGVVSRGGSGNHHHHQHSSFISCESSPFGTNTLNSCRSLKSGSQHTHQSNGFVSVYVDREFTGNSITGSNHRRARSYDQNDCSNNSSAPNRASADVTTTVRHRGVSVSGEQLAPRETTQTQSQRQLAHNQSIGCGIQDYSTSVNNCSASVYGPTLMQLRMLASSSANLDEKSRDNVLECLEEVVYNKLCGQYEFLFEKEFELELLLNYLITDNDSDTCWKLSGDIYSSSSRGLALTASPNGTHPSLSPSEYSHSTGRIRSQSAAALVRTSECEGDIPILDIPVVAQAASMRSASSEDKLSMVARAQHDGLVQPIKIVYPSSSYEKSKTVKLHRLCQENVPNFRRENSARTTNSVLAGFKFRETADEKNYSDNCLSSTEPSGTNDSVIGARLRNLSGSRTRLHRTRTLKGGIFLDKL